MSKTIYPGKMVGILGGGQLGKMLGQSAQKMGYRVAMYDESDGVCGFGVSHLTQVGSFNDQESVLGFARSVDVLTYEFENINGKILQQLNEQVHLPQGASFLLTTQHRLTEKNWLQAQGIVSVDYRSVENQAELVQALNELGYPAVLKTARFGYDGKGQVVLRSEVDVLENQDVRALLEGACILEAFCPFDYEASIIVARDQHGNIECFPPVVNTHIEGILAASVTTRKITSEIEAKMKHMAETIAGQAGLIGVCGIEFFVTAAGDVLVNEMAPRPHNTGHHTIEGCNVSQFDQHVLAVTGRAIVPIRTLTPTLMVNILGQHMEHLPALMAEFPEAMVHLYDKGEAKMQRKMGHFTIMAECVEELEQILAENAFIQSWFDAIKGE